MTAPKRRQITKLVDYSFREYENHEGFKVDEDGNYVYDDFGNPIREDSPPNPGKYGPRQLISVALEQVNLVRMALAIGEGKIPKLPQGIRSDGQFCVLARALSNGWTPNVTEEGVRLTHKNDGTIDFKSAVAALESHGFKDVRIKGSVGVSSRGRKVAVEFATPDAMAQLIQKFDAGDLRSLIVPEEKEFALRNELLAKQESK